MLIVSQETRSTRDIDTEQVDRQIVREVRCIDYRNSNCSVRIDIGADVDFFYAALGINADRAWASETEVGCEGLDRNMSVTGSNITGGVGVDTYPESCGNEVIIVLQADQSVVTSRVLRAPPMRVAGCITVSESVVHVDRPLKPFAVGKSESV